MRKMSYREKNNTKNSMSIRKPVSSKNDKLFSSSFPKKMTKPEFIQTKSSFNPKYVSSFAKIIDNENEECLSNFSQDSEYNKNREEQLEILNNKYKKLYDSKEKIYANIIKEIEVEKKFFYKGSIMSFNILILKIKCHMKILKDKFESSLNSKEDRNYEVDLNIQKIKNEFIKLYAIVDENSKYEYEILTQIYCKFLFIMAVISNKKEEYIRSFNYITLGINMLKVYFIRQRVAIDIDTYKIYAKLIILLINKLLTDNNISQSLIYSSLLSKVAEVGLNIVHKKKLNKKYEYKFNRYIGCNFLFLGYCYELKKNIHNNNKIPLKIYYEAFYFISKSCNLSIFAENSGIINIEKKALYLSQLIYEKLKEKLIYETLEKQREYEQQEMIKKQLIEEAKSKEKKLKLTMISSGIVPDTYNLVKIQQKIYNKILTPVNQRLIDKLDDEIISYVYKNKQSGNESDKKDLNEKKIKLSKKYGRSEKRMPSMEIMKNLCHYKMYNSLMTNDFKEFLLNNRKLKFNYPQYQKTSLDKIQKYLNRKMEIDSNAEKEKENDNKVKNINKNKEKDKEKEKESIYALKTETNASSENNCKTKIINLKANNKKIKYKLNLKLNDITKDNTFDSNSMNYTRKKIASNRPSTTNNKHSFIISRDKKEKSQKSNDKRNNRYYNYTVLFNNYKNNKNKKKITSKNHTSINVERSKLDKFIFNKKYFKEYVYFDKLTNKELSFQKQFLESKNNNSKMYFRGFDKELFNNGKISRDEIYNSFLILNNNATAKEVIYDKDLKNKENKRRIIGNVFKSVGNKVKGGKEIKNVMKKVLDRYINSQKVEKNNQKRKANMISVEEINRKNESSLMQLNNNINEINYLLVSKSHEAKINNNKNNNFLNISDI